MENENTVATNATQNETNAGAQANVVSNNNDETYATLDRIVEKRLPSVLKSALKDNGATDDEIKEILTGYKNHKETVAKTNNDELAKLKVENETLKNNIFNEKIKTTISGLSDKLGFNSKYADQITKLADLTDVNKNGEVDTAKLEESIKKVLEDCEAFKSTKQPENTTGFTQIGAAQTENETSDMMTKMMKAMKLSK